MYRLLKLRKMSLNGTQALSVNFKVQNIHLSDRTCSLCKQLHLNNSVRFQSTHTHPNIVPKKPRKRTKPKPFAEILIVRNSSASECKAKIQNLGPNDVKMLALTNLNLNEFYKLMDVMKSNSKVFNEYTYNNLTDVNNFPTPLNTGANIHEMLPSLKTVISDRLPVSNMVETVPNIEEDFIKPKVIQDGIDIDFEGETRILDVLQQVKPNAAFQPEELEEEIIEEEIKPTTEEPKKKIKFDMKAREEMLARTLAAYIEVCVSLKTPQRGLNALNFIRFRAKKRAHETPTIKNINVYNAILKGFASKGDYQKLKEVLRMARDENVKLNVQSYAAIFECLARVNYDDNYLKQIRIFLKEAANEGITFNRILNEATFLYDQRDKVLEAMKAHDSSFEPTYYDPSVQFCNHLVDQLNHEDQLKGLPEVQINETQRGIFTKEQLQDFVKKQMQIEENVSVTIKSIESKPEPTKEVLKYRALWSEHLKIWEEAAKEAFNRDLAALACQRNSLNLEPYLRSIPLKEFIKIILDEAQKMAQGSETYSPTANMLHRDLGSKVYARYKVLKKQKSGVLDKIYAIHTKYCENYADSHKKLNILPGEIDNLNTRQKWQWTQHHFINEGATISMDHQEWVPTAMQAIGKFLYNIVMHDIKIDVNVMRNNSKHKNYLPAFYTIFRNQGRIVKEEVKPHPILAKLYRSSVPETLSFPAYEIPMLCPPVPWISVNTGGYLVAPCDVVRLPLQATEQRKILKETQPNQLYPSLDALNQLAAVPWKVNRRILDTILEVFKNGGSSKLDVPEPPSSLSPPQSITPDMDKTEKYNLHRQKLQFRRKKAEMYSLWCDCLYRLSLANHFKDDIFWLPHNMDFRGRVYPVPPHLNHLGSDLARSMLIFAEARPLGPNGLDWLKLHLINLTGLMKRDRIDDRLIYANDIIHKILDSADNPLTGEMWWAESDEPWQTLACCMEIANAHRSPNPEEYLCHFPVHQDGSCNGLQHYAALGRDSAGAFSVNLTPAKEPQDVYSAVAALVEEQRKRDAENGSEIAKVLDGFVKRKVIKQTVMTTVYGVTRFGARLQIAKQLKDIDNFPKDSVWSGSSYLTGRTFDSLRTMFTSTKEIQDWFTECARQISSVCSRNVEWITPLGLPIVQPYFRYKRLNSTNVFETFHMDSYEKPNVMKQKNAFPPNFIHSLDSSHMMLTSLHCERAGITFVSVHDCYWTHPSTVHIMNKICREQFVALHSEPILEDLSLFMSQKYSFEADEIVDDGSVTELTKKKLNRVLRKLPRTGRFDIKEVLDSVYFFS